MMILSLLDRFKWWICVILLVIILLIKVFLWGSDYEQYKHAKNDLDSLKERVEIENEVNSKNDDAVRTDLHNWVRKHK